MCQGLLQHASADAYGTTSKSLPQLKELTDEAGCDGKIRIHGPGEICSTLF